MCSKGKEDRWFVTNCPLHSSHTLRLYLTLLQMVLDFNIFLTVDEAWIMWSAFHTSLHFHTMKNKQSQNSEHWHLFLIHSDWITHTVGKSHSGDKWSRPDNSLCKLCSGPHVCGMHTWRFNLSSCWLDEDNFSAKFPTMMLFNLVLM